MFYLFFFMICMFFCLDWTLDGNFLIVLLKAYDILL